jgi:UDP-N-acetylglucosamine 2-epimerase (non-hydrolysing)
MAKLGRIGCIEHVTVIRPKIRYETNEIFTTHLKIRKRDYFLNAAGMYATETAGQIIINIDSVLEREHPEAFWYWATPTRAFAQMQPRNGIFPFSLWTGNRGFVQRVRRKQPLNVDHIADINYVQLHCAGIPLAGRVAGRSNHQNGQSDV